MTDSKAQIEEAVKVLRAGGVLLYPTDTIWGIGCDATDSAAVEKVFSIKQRADSKSLIILACDMGMVDRYVREVPEMAVTVESLSDKPLTIIYPEGINLAPNVTAEDGSIAIRIPKNDFCIELAGTAFRQADSVNFRQRLGHSGSPQIPGYPGGDKICCGYVRRPCIGSWLHRKGFVHHQTWSPQRSSGNPRIIVNFF